MRPISIGTSPPLVVVPWEDWLRLEALHTLFCWWATERPPDLEVIQRIVARLPEMDAIPEFAPPGKPSKKHMRAKLRGLRPIFIDTDPPLVIAPLDQWASLQTLLFPLHLDVLLSKDGLVDEAPDQSTYRKLLQDVLPDDFRPWWLNDVEEGFQILLGNPEVWSAYLAAAKRGYDLEAHEAELPLRLAPASKEEDG